MWLSDNQAKPMLQLQSDILETTGKRVLTCFMFPQHRRDPEDDKPIDKDFYISDGESFHASLWEEQRRERMQIAFDVSESENECNKSSIDRIPSPYPKEGVKLRPHVGNDNVHEPWHSSPIPSRKKSRDRTSYPKEGIKQRHRKSHEEEDLPDGRPHLARKMNGQAINALPNYPNVDTGVRGRRDARMKEAKISRPRVSTSPIHDSLQLFRADKEKMAKDKLRIRHSSPEKSESEGDNKRSDSEMYSPKRTRVLGRRKSRYVAVQAPSVGQRKA
ncbi:uncharacterized protein [Amphiura filiformis]|uniref:uncharacterized protein n=1 Tax=Amphiura filiformis TaxID=82378 RepID=UPI003B22234E